MRLLMVMMLAPMLGGCWLARDGGEAAVPVAVMPGPVFSESRVDCGQKPVPPDPTAAGAKAGSAAAHYEGRLGVWGQRCSNQLQSVGNELRGAGLVVGD